MLQAFGLNTGSREWATVTVTLLMIKVSILEINVAILHGLAPSMLYLARKTRLTLVKEI